MATADFSQSRHLGRAPLTTGPLWKVSKVRTDTGLANFRLKTLDFLSLWSGQNPTGCREIPAAWLTQELATSLWRAGANNGTDWNWVPEWKYQK